MFCTKCGSQLEDGSKFCTTCGNKIDSAESQTSNAASADETRQPSLSEQPTQALPTTIPTVAATQQTAKIPVVKAAPTATVAPAMPVTNTQSQQTGKKGNGPLIAILVAIIVILIAAAVVVFVFLIPSGFFDSSKPETTTTSQDSSSSSSSSSSSNSSSSSSSSTASSSSSADSTASSSISNADYLLPEVASRLYTAADLAALSDYELYLARNEIFARHGRGFLNEDLVQYFSSKPWYTQIYTPQDFDSMPSPLNSIELANLDLIRSVEADRDSEYAV